MKFIRLFRTVGLTIILAMTLAWSVMSFANEPTVNLNTATAAELVTALDGVGEVKAAAIVALRDQLESFTDVSQLLQVKGIGASTLQRNIDKIVLE